MRTFQFPFFAMHFDLTGDMEALGRTRTRTTYIMHPIWSQDLSKGKRQDGCIDRVYYTYLLPTLVQIDVLAAR